MVKNESDFLNFNKQLNMNLLGKYGFPEVKGIKIRHPEDIKMLGFNYATNPETKDKEKQWVHFFLPDCRFQQVWNNPDAYIDCFKQYKGIVTPNFSMYTSMPLSMQIFNCYRQAFMCAYYQQHDIKVLPAPCWVDEYSYDWCFDWVPKNSAVVISTVGCLQNRESYRLFLKGYEKMCEVCEPFQVIVYGHVPKELSTITPEYYRHPDFMEIRCKTALWKQPKEWDKMVEVDGLPKRIALHEKIK